MLNNVILVGRLTQDPEIVEIEKDKKVTTVILAVNRNFKNSDGIYETDFIRCILWNSVASTTTEYCRVGDVIGVKGRLQTSKYEDENKKTDEKTTRLNKNQDLYADVYLNNVYVDIDKLNAFKEKYNILKEEVNKQIKREKNKDNIELYLKDCIYYKGILNEFLDLIDASLSKYNFIKRLSDFKIDNEDINISINEILDLRCDYISLNILFNNKEKNNVENYLSNIYFDIILREIKNLNDSYLFKELSLIEKKKVQLILMKRIRENISKTKFRKEHLEELINNIFSLDDFRIYLKLMYKYNKSIINEVSLVKVK